VLDAGARSCISTSVVKPGGDPPLGHQCGGVSGIAATSGAASDLTNGVEYAVGVAAVDQVGNVGKLSNNVCVVPVEVTDFFELYRGDGGGGGGGFCSVSARRVPAPVWLIGLVGALAMARGARRLRGRR
jgi:hypothetical protein